MRGTSVTLEGIGKARAIIILMAVDGNYQGFSSSFLVSSKEITCFNAGGSEISGNDFL